MRWLLIVFLVSLIAMLFAAAGVAFHIFRQRARQGSEMSAAFEPIEEPEVKAKR